MVWYGNHHDCHPFKSGLFEFDFGVSQNALLRLAQTPKIEDIALF